MSQCVESPCKCMSHVQSRTEAVRHELISVVLHITWLCADPVRSPGPESCCCAWANATSAELIVSLFLTAVIQITTMSRMEMRRSMPAARTWQAA